MFLYVYLVVAVAAVVYLATMEVETSGILYDKKYIYLNDDKKYKKYKHNIQQWMSNGAMVMILVCMNDKKYIFMNDERYTFE